MQSLLHHVEALITQWCKSTLMRQRRINIFSYYLLHADCRKSVNPQERLGTSESNPVCCNDVHAAPSWRGSIVRVVKRGTGVSKDGSERGTGADVDEPSFVSHLTPVAEPPVVKSDEGPGPSESSEASSIAPLLARNTTRFTQRPLRVLRAATQREHWLVIALILAYVSWFTYQSMRMYYGYGYAPFDLAIFDQGYWLLTHFHIPFVTVMGRNLFGDHTSFILLAFAPFYRMFPEPQGLLVFQTLAIAAAAIPIYLIARKLIHNSTIATLLVAVFLLNPSIEQGNLQQFHPEALQVLIISLALYAAIESRRRLLFVMVALSLLVKEDAAVLVVPLGLWVLWRRDRKWGYWIIGAALAWTAVALQLIIPTLLGKSSLYAGDLPFNGVSGFFRTALRTPGQLIAYLRQSGRPYYVWQMGFMTGWGFLLSPELAAIGFFLLFENVISSLPYMQQYQYQFSMPLAPILVVGTIWAIARQSNVRRRNLVTGVVFTCALWSSFLWGLAPFSISSVNPTWAPNSAIVKAVNKLEAKIPANAVVVAWYLFVPHLDHRTQIYLWPTPFDTQNYGLFNNNGARLPQAASVQYLMLPVPIASDNNPTVFASISSSFTLVASNDGIGLFKRISP